MLVLLIICNFILFIQFIDVFTTQSVLWNKIISHPTCTTTRELHAAYNIPYVYDFITQLCR